MAQSTCRLVPWESWQLWNEVRKALFSSSPGHVLAALNKISAWRTRNSLPVAVEVTWDLISIQRTDPYFLGNFGGERPFSDELLRLMYAMAIMRLINGIVDHSKKQSSLSVADRAEAAGLPRMLVDIRHEVAHQELPSLSYMRLASKEALDWLKLHYWEAQKSVLDNAHKHLRCKLQDYASRYDASKDKAIFEGGPKRSIILLAKKLVELSGPAINLMDECNIQMNTMHEVKGETGHEKQKDVLFSEDTLDAEFQNNQCALSRARKRLRSVCRGHQLTEGALEVDIDEMDSNLNATSSDSVDDDREKIGNGAIKSHFLSMGPWSVVDNWRHCAIGLLPSKIHREGVLPFSQNPFDGIAEEGSARGAADIVPNKTHSQVLLQKTGEGLDTLETKAQISIDNQIEEGRECLESEESDIDMVRKRLKMDTEAKHVIGNPEDKSCCSASANNEVVKVVPPVTPFSHKHKDSVLLKGLLLVEGVYQRLNADNLAAIRSSIQILK